MDEIARARTKAMCFAMFPRDISEFNQINKERESTTRTVRQKSIYYTAFLLATLNSKPYFPDAIMIKKKKKKKEKKKELFLQSRTSDATRNHCGA